MKRLLFCQEKTVRKIKDILVLPLREFLGLLWSDALVRKVRKRRAGATFRLSELTQNPKTRPGIV